MNNISNNISLIIILILRFIDVHHVERNIELFKTQLIETINKRIAFGKKLIDDELSSPFDIIVKPIVKTFYDFYSKDALKGILRQIEIIIECGKEFINKEENEDSFNNKVDKMFPEYLQGDQLSGMCKKSHENYPQLKALLKEVFISQIQESMILFKVLDEVNDYNSLIRAAFKTREVAYKTLITQLDSYDECLRMIGKDLSILTFPTAKKRIFNVLKRGSEVSNKDFIIKLDEIYQ